jgi:hypothetical protein
MPSALEPTTTTTTSVLGESSPHRTRRASLKVLNRNIGQVVLGNLLFDTWYYSPYPDNIILGATYQPPSGGGSGGKHSSGTAAELRNGGVTGPHNVLLNHGEPACRRLYVCPTCFRYTPSEADYTAHLRYHASYGLHRQEQQQQLLLPVPESAVKVYEWDGYEVWEIDGEKEKLYCQNLSLFGKLFLEQKSVFFDTSGFKYYVLTFTPAEELGRRRRSGGGGGRGRKRSSSLVLLDEEDVGGLGPPQTQVLGFFSKENLSWDSNNLACILIFPPFQHRQLGQLLMAVSYKLSGWEWEGGVIGGPEKPLSAMGRKSYLRFWSGRIARFMMGQSLDADAKRVFQGARKRTARPRREEMTVMEIGERTGMLAEDVVAALTEMGVCKAVGPKKAKKNNTTADEKGGNFHDHSEAGNEEGSVTMVVQRSRIVEWAEKNGVDIVSPVREEGFLGEWALSDLDGSDENSKKQNEDDDEDKED